MATQGSPLVDVNVIGPPVQAVAGIPIGALLDVDIVTTVQAIGAINFTSRFPTPPAAFGFLGAPDDDFAFSVMDPIATGTLIGVLLPEGKYLEPTLGQIWPRIG